MYAKIFCSKAPWISDFESHGHTWQVYRVCFAQEEKREKNHNPLYRTPEIVERCVEQRPTSKQACPNGSERAGVRNLKLTFTINFH